MEISGPPAFSTSTFAARGLALFRAALSTKELQLIEAHIDETPPTAGIRLRDLEAIRPLLSKEGGIGSMPRR